MFEEILKALAEKLKTAELYEGVILALNEAKLIDNSEGLYLKKDSGDWIPRAKVDEERAKMKKQIEDQSGLLEGLQKTIEAGGDVKVEIEKMKVAALELGKKHETETGDLMLSHAVDLKIMGQKLTSDEYVPMVKGLLDMSVISLTEKGLLIGIDDQLTSIKEKDAFKPWFGEKKVVGNPPSPSKTPEPSTETAQLGELYNQSLKDNGAVNANTIAAKRAYFASVESDKKKSAVLAA